MPHGFRFFFSFDLVCVSVIEWWVKVISAHRQWKRCTVLWSKHRVAWRNKWTDRIIKL